MPAFDLDAYFNRIGLTTAPTMNADGLAAIQRAHRLTIPFENLDIPLGQGVSLEPGHVFDKLVTRRRGGYCFEQNQLFMRALHALGFEVRPLLARVWLMADGVPPRTHTLLLAALDDQNWIADAGFGGSFTPIMPLKTGLVHTTPDGAKHRLVVHSEHGWMLERDGGNGQFQPQYSFMLDHVWPADLVLSNHFTAAMPNTRFTTFKIVSIPTETGYASLTDRNFFQTNHDDRSISNMREYREILADAFGIELAESQIWQLGLFEN